MRPGPGPSDPSPPCKVRQTFWSSKPMILHGRGINFAMFYGIPYRLLEFLGAYRKSLDFLLKVMYAHVQMNVTISTLGQPRDFPRNCSRKAEKTKQIQNKNACKNNVFTTNSHCLYKIFLKTNQEKQKNTSTCL